VANFNLQFSFTLSEILLRIMISVREGDETIYLQYLYRIIIICKVDKQSYWMHLRGGG
jgi:hypothetical protein